MELRKSLAFKHDIPNVNQSYNLYNKNDHESLPVHRVNASVFRFATTDEQIQRRFEAYSELTLQITTEKAKSRLIPKH